jgi:hypothetical protein
MVRHKKRTESGDDPDEEDLLDDNPTGADLSHGEMSDRCRAQIECEVRSDPALWRALTFPGYATVRDDLKRLEAQGNGSGGKARTPFDKPGAERIALGSREALDEGLRAMKRDDGHQILKPSSWWRSFKLFYSGSRIELALTAIHRARAALYLLYPNHELDAQTDRLQELVGDLPEANPLRGSLTTSLGHLRKPGKSKSALRARLQQIYEQAIGVSESLQREARALRNAMMIASFGLGLVLLTLGSAHAIEKHFVNLCSVTQHSTPPSPGATPVATASAKIAGTGRSSVKSGEMSALGGDWSSSLGSDSIATARASLAKSATSTAKDGSPATKNEDCPLDHSLTSFDVFALELAGMFGGLLSVVIPLATGERVKTPYGIFNHLLILKILAGAATAVAGVMLVEAGLVSKLSFESSAAVLAYAVVFGFAQQLVTGFIDRRASTLAKETLGAKGV